MIKQLFEYSRQKWKTIGPYYRFAFLQLPFYLIILYGVHAYQTRNLIPEEKTAPAFTLTDLKGDSFSLEQYKGKPVMIYFFAPWCSVCNLTSASVGNLHNADTKDETVVLAVGLSYNNVQELEIFAKKHSLEMPVLAGDSRVAEQYHISGFPTFYFIDSKGKVTSRTIGFTTQTGMNLRL
ncbi:MAG: redoxin domain-containing protein [Leptospirales bacterium]